MRAVFGGFYATYLLMIESLTLADLQKDTSPLERFGLTEHDPDPEPAAED